MYKKKFIAGLVVLAIVFIAIMVGLVAFGLLPVDKVPAVVKPVTALLY